MENVKLLAYSPLAMGLLTVSLTEGATCLAAPCKFVLCLMYMLAPSC